MGEDSSFFLGWECPECGKMMASNRPRCARCQGKLNRERNAEKRALKELEESKPKPSSH